MMIRTILAVAALGLGLSVAAAQDPIAARKALMKATGEQSAIGAKMVRGELPFDLVKAQAIFTQFEKTSAEAPKLFPDTAKTGGETAALPAVWEHKGEFDAKLAKLGADSKDAAGKVKDLDSFKVAFPAVGKNCGGCHETFRAKKS